MATSFDADENYSLKIEAQEVIKEIRYAVKDVELSEQFKPTDEQVYFNLMTKENECFCVELTLRGFRLAGRKYNTLEQLDEAKYYETIYALLDSISPEYRNTFSDTLMRKLQGLKNQQ